MRELSAGRWAMIPLPHGVLLRYGALAVVVWTGLVAFSFSWNVSHLRSQARELALNTARASLNKDQAYRLWSSAHGGVYVRPDERTPPSPYLAHLSERDVVTAKGVKLTLMNPAYMLRQMMNEYSTLYGIKGRIVAKVALNPSNKATQWEAAAIDSFERGAKELVDIASIDGVDHLRLFKPFLMRASCVKCHGPLGFKVGDVRGAVGVSVPMAPYQKNASKGTQSMLVSHGVIWFLGFLGISVAVGASANRSRERERQHQKEQQLHRELEQHVGELDVALTQEHTLLDEINHRVGNNLSALLGLLDGERETATRPEQTASLARIEARIRGLASVHRMLSQVSWSRLPLLDLCTEVLTEACRGALPTPQIGVAGSGVDVSAQQAPHLAIVLSELCMNALKHGEPGVSASVVAEISETGEMVAIKLRDSGVGYPAEILNGKPKFGRRGLALVRAVVEHSLGGNVEFTNDDGAVTTIEFPKQA